ncbi:hypothetical protein AVEN_170806-1 [Araneus ventricosus]|uniref:Uncharacterized protein n=1 Tax=Araneus ventricosus TaxID=182803 RepID=A0A4Y2TE61_ARAVE|nr:hypothetical protein AVEN_163176-1 [Araneus ventricosus]GBN98934.1 hypothetical protein AVEN_170806-1 [Araneus ventricosus]
MVSSELQADKCVDQKEIQTKCVDQKEIQTKCVDQKEIQTKLQHTFNEMIQSLFFPRLKEKYTQFSQWMFKVKSMDVKILQLHILFHLQFQSGILVSPPPLDHDKQDHIILESSLTRTRLCRAFEVLSYDILNS